MPMSVFAEAVPVGMRCSETTVAKERKINSPQFNETGVRNALIDAGPRQSDRLGR